MTDYDHLPILRTSERRTFKRCPQQWQWAWRMGLRPVAERGGALWFGTGVHLALEHWYIPGRKRGVDPRETWADFVKDRLEVIKVEMLSGDAPEGSDVLAMDAKELGIKIFDNYLDTYGQDEEWEILSPEQTFSILIPQPGGREPIIRFVGTFDIVALHIPTGKLWLWDHKTAKAIQTSHLPLDDQAGGYFAVAPMVLAHQGIVPKGTVLEGILYNFIMKSPKDERPVNERGQSLNQPKKEHYVAALANLYSDWDTAKQIEVLGKPFEKLTVKALTEIAEENKLTVLGDVSEKQPSKRFHRELVVRTRKEIKSQIERIGAEAVVMNQFRDGSLPIIKNPTKDCQWDCDFRNMCELHERGGDIEEYMDVVYKQEDPYAAHRREGDET